MLKLDEGDARGPVGIRVKSFIETVKARRAANLPDKPESNEPLFHTPFLPEDKKRRRILTPNLSPAFSVLASEYMKREGFIAEYLPVADRKAIELGKKYVHNDICFPCQVNIGEALHWLVDHPEVPQNEVSMCLAKNCENCRAVQYAVLARKALDEAGFKDVTIITTGVDYKGMHPGFQLGLDFRLHMLWGLVTMDAIETGSPVRSQRRRHPEDLRRMDAEGDLCCRSPLHHATRAPLQAHRSL